VSVRTIAAAVACTAAAFVVGCSSPEVVETSEEKRGAVPAPQATTPDTTSGPLTQDDLPRPSDLGPRWSYRVDLGSIEDGYVGSGAPAISRDPTEVVAALTPLGCRPVDLPVPEHALEVTYRQGAKPGVGLLLSFDDTTSAHSFFSAHAGVLRECVGGTRLPGRIMIDDEDAFVSVRTERLPHSPTWTEGMSLAGEQVLLLAATDTNHRVVTEAMTSF
jgi:hypothetical protein